MYGELIRAMFEIELVPAPTARMALPRNFRFSDTTKTDDELIKIARMYCRG